MTERGASEFEERDVRGREPEHDAVVEAERRSRGRAAALPVMSLNLVAMIDVVFLLLVYFMLTADFRRPEEGVALDLPARLTTALDPLALPARPIEVLVESDEAGAAVRVEHPALAGVTTVEGLRREGRIRYGTEFGEGQPFVVRAGSGTRWEDVLRAYNALRGAGYERVRLAEPGGAG